MKMKKLAGLLMAGVMVLSLAACSSNDDASGKDNTEEENVEANDQADDTDAAEDDTAAGEEFENMTVDADNKEVSFEAVVNGTYFTEPTRHAIVWEEGGNADKAMFRAKAYNVDLHDALVSLGLSGDSNVSMDQMSSTVEDNIVNTGDALEYFVKWDGQDEIPLNDVIKASAEYDWNVVFAGNRDVAEETQAGCLLCMDSCAAGVAVNALPVGTTSEDGTQFYLDEEKAPEDGTTVTITVRPAE
ncbi:MAG: YdjY domain-containing protein [Lachnospiraceae bacterium]